MGILTSLVGDGQICELVTELWSFESFGSTAKAILRFRVIESLPEVAHDECRKLPVGSGPDEDILGFYAGIRLATLSSL